MAKTFRYRIAVERTSIHVGIFEVVSRGKKLYEDEACKQAQEMADRGDEPEDGWEENDVSYEVTGDFEDGADDLRSDD